MELYAPLNLLSIVHVSGRIHSHIAFKNPDLAACNTKKGRSDASDLPFLVLHAARSGFLKAMCEWIRPDTWTIDSKFKGA
jgi:hypothetical protein